MKSVTGTFLRSDGTPAAGASVNFLLSQPEDCSLGLLVHERVTVILDEDGSLPADFELICNDEMYTLGSFYTITVVDPVEGRVLYENVVIYGESPIALQGLQPIYVQ